MRKLAWSKEIARCAVGAWAVFACVDAGAEPVDGTMWLGAPGPTSDMRYQDAQYWNNHTVAGDGGIARGHGHDPEQLHERGDAHGERRVLVRGADRG